MSAALQILLYLMVKAPYVFTKTISSDTTNYNLRNDALAAGWNGTDRLLANITIASGIVVSADNTSKFAFDTDTYTYPAGSLLNLTNNGGYIVGMGGAGGAGGGSSPGTAGGHAIRISLTTNIDNTGGTIGGGGGGGSGYNYYDSFFATYYYYGGGGGRTGRTNSLGGQGTGVNSSAYANSGTFSAPGAAMNSSGAGGQWGSAGNSGSGYYPPAAGGYAVKGNNLVNWVASGTIYGSLDNTPITTTSPPVAISARYWRIYITANNTDTYYSMQEIELRNMSGTDLTSPGMTTSQSDYYGSNTAAKVIDNDTTDYANNTWVSDGSAAPHWVAIDAGAVISPSSLAILCQAYAGGPTRAPKDFLVQTSTTGLTGPWSTVATVTGATGWTVGTYKTFAFS